MAFDRESRIVSSHLNSVIKSTGAKNPGRGDTTEQLILPFVERIQEGSAIQLKTIATIKEALSLPFDGAIVVTDERVRTFLREYALDLGISLARLSDYPGAEYDAHFQQFTFDLPSVSYNELIGEIITNERVDRMARDQAGARQKQAPRQAEIVRDRKSHFDSFVKAREGDANLVVTGDDDAGDA